MEINKNSLDIIEDYKLSPEETLIALQTDLLEKFPDLINISETLESILAGDEINVVLDKMKGVGIGELSEEQKANLETFITEEIDTQIEEINSVIEKREDTIRRTNSYIDKKIAKIKTIKGVAGKDGTEITREQLISKLKEKPFLKIKDLEDGKDILESLTKHRKDINSNREVINTHTKKISKLEKDIKEISHTTYIGGGDGGTVDLSGYQTTDEKGVAGGYAELDTDGKIPESQLPESALCQYCCKWSTVETTDPVATDDSTKDYCVGSRWWNTTDKKDYICIDNTENGAVWELMQQVAVDTSYLTDDNGNPLTDDSGNNLTQ